MSDLFYLQFSRQSGFDENLPIFIFDRDEFSFVRNSEKIIAEQDSSIVINVALDQDSHRL